MPEVKGEKFEYTEEGKKAAAAAEKRKNEKRSKEYRKDAFRDRAREFMPDESSLFVDMMKAMPGSNWDKAYRATDRKGPDIRPMDQKQKDVRKVKAENAKKMADILGPWAGYTREDDARDREAAGLPPNPASEKDWAAHERQSEQAREKYRNPQHAYDEGDFDPEDWGLDEPPPERGPYDLEWEAVEERRSRQSKADRERRYRMRVEEQKKEIRENQKRQDAARGIKRSGK